MELEESSDGAQNEADDMQSFFESELEALQSIYINEIEVKQDDDQKSTCVSIELHPATADKPEEQYVRMTLKFILCEEYPQTIPGISIHNPRGLSDEKLNSIHQDLVSVAEQKIGNSMLFEIIEAAKEHLTTGNRPCGECAICLYGFNEEDIFTKTDCYHYFHSHCLARYAKNALKSEREDKEASVDDTVVNNELLCPMCRVPIQFGGSEEQYPPPSAGDEEYVINERISEMQKMMADLYQQQLEKGGIIDIEAEKNKFLLEISNVPTRLNVTEEEDSPDALNDTEENSVSQSAQKDKMPPNKDVQNEPKNASSKFKERTRSDKYVRKGDKSANQKSHSDHYGSTNKYDKRYERNAENFEDDPECNFRSDDLDPPEEVDTELLRNRDTQNNRDGSPESRPAKPSPIRKDRQRSNNYPRPKRNNYDDYSRDNQFRNSYPGNKNRGRGYGQNSYQRYNYKDWSDQNSRRYESGRPNKFHNDVNNRTEDVTSEETRDSLDNKNVSDSYRKNNYFDRGHYRGRGRFQGRRHSDNFYRDRETNYPKKGYQKQQVGRNAYRHDEDFDNKEKSSQFKNDHHSKYEKNASQHNSSDIEAPPFAGELQSPLEANPDESASGSHPSEHQQKNSAKNTGASFRGRHSPRKGKTEEYSKSETNDYSTTSHKSQSTDNHDVSSYDEDPLDKVNSRKPTSHRDSNTSRNSNRYDRDGSHRPEESNYDKSDCDHYNRQPVRDRRSYPSRKNYDSEESGSQFQRNERYSQENASRRNMQRNSYGGNQYNQSNFRDRGRGRGNPHYQNRNPNYEGNQRKFRYNNENPGFRNERDSQKFKDSTRSTYSEGMTASTQNGSLCDDLQQVNSKISSDGGAPEINGSKNFNVDVKPFVPKEDIGAASADIALCKDENVVVVVNPELNSPKMPSPPPGFSNPLKKVVYGLKAANPPPGFPRR